VATTAWIAGNLASKKQSELNRLINPGQQWQARRQISINKLSCNSSFCLFFLFVVPQLYQSVVHSDTAG
jgi:hypothetical protein